MQSLWNHVRDKKGGHDIDHVRRVYRWAELLAAWEEDVDYEVLRPAVILHDICREEEDEDPTGRTDHAAAGAVKARTILLSEGFDAARADKICACIATHRYSSDQSPPESIEAKLLFDADKLDGLGAVGVARLFMLAGQYGERLYVPPPKGFGDGTRKGYRIADLSEYSANLEFIGKMRYVPERLFLEQSKREARRLLEPMRAFFELLEQELAYLESGGAPRHSPAPPPKEDASRKPSAVTIYTDGACKRNPGPGGWACILRFGDTEKELCGGEAHTTNNRMELLAAIVGLEALTKGCDVDLYSDSQYLVNGFGKWMHNWVKRDWHKDAARKEKVLNDDLWKRLWSLSKQHRIQLHWVRGHADNEYNNRCDALASGMAQSAASPLGNRGKD